MKMKSQIESTFASCLIVMCSLIAIREFSFDFFPCTKSWIVLFVFFPSQILPLSYILYRGSTFFQNILSLECVQITNRLYHYFSHVNIFEARFHIDRCYQTLFQTNLCFQLIVTHASSLY